MSTQESVLHLSRLILTAKEANLILFIRELGYGECRVIVYDKQPDRIEQAVKVIKL